MTCSVPGALRLPRPESVALSESDREGVTLAVSGHTLSKMDLTQGGWASRIGLAVRKRLRIFENIALLATEQGGIAKW